jgi:hypothetical protein
MNILRIKIFCIKQNLNEKAILQEVHLFEYRYSCTITLLLFHDRTIRNWMTIFRYISDHGCITKTKCSILLRN